MAMTWTGGTRFAIRANTNLAAGATATFNVDTSTVDEGRLHIANTPGGTIAATRGLKVEIFMQSGSGANYDTFPYVPVTILPSAVASVLEERCFTLPTGKFQVKITNLDVSNAITVGATLDTVS